MSVQLTCMRCPYFHPAGQDCPPGWHDVQAEGGDGSGGGDGSNGGVTLAKVAGWAGLGLAAWIVLILVVLGFWQLYTLVTR